MKSRTWGPRLRKVVFVTAGVVACLFSNDGLALAASFTDNGSIYTINAPTLVVGDTYAVTLSINTAGFTGAGPNPTLNAAAVKITSAGDFLSGSLIPNPTGGFSYVVGQTSAGGCAGVANGFVCASNPTLGAGGATVPNGTYAFTWNVTLKPGGTVLALSDISVKALYLKDTGQVSAQTSRTVPEPSSLLLLGFGLTALGLWQWSRRRDVQA